MREWRHTARHTAFFRLPNWFTIVWLQRKSLLIRFPKRFQKLPHVKNRKCLLGIINFFFLIPIELLRQRIEQIEA